MYVSILEHARIVSRDSNTKIQVRHQPACPALDGGHCRCDVTVKILRPARKRGQK